MGQISPLPDLLDAHDQSTLQGMLIGPGKCLLLVFNKETMGGIGYDNRDNRVLFDWDDLEDFFKKWEEHYWVIEQVWWGQ